jgi:hypothetical protein
MLVCVLVCVLVLPAFAGKFAFWQGGKISEKGKSARGFSLFPFMAFIVKRGGYSRVTDFESLQVEKLG